MKNLQKSRIENFILADMHTNGVYFDRDILKASKEKTSTKFDMSKDRKRA